MGGISGSLISRCSVKICSEKTCRCMVQTCTVCTCTVSMHSTAAHFLWPAPSTPAAGFAGGAGGADAACAACEEAECLGGATTGLLGCLHTASKGQYHAFVTCIVQLVLYLSWCQLTWKEMEVQLTSEHPAVHLCSGEEVRAVLCLDCSCTQIKVAQSANSSRVSCTLLDRRTVATHYLLWPLLECL